MPECPGRTIKEMTEKNKSPNSPTKILFLVWGFSIHAKRRMEIFLDDSDFLVSVVSPFNYGFPRIKNILLGSNQESSTGSLAL